MGICCADGADGEGIAWMMPTVEEGAEGDGEENEFDFLPLGVGLFCPCAKRLALEASEIQSLTHFQKSSFYSQKMQSS